MAKSIMMVGASYVQSIVKDSIAKAVALMRRSPSCTDLEIWRKLVAGGLDASVSARLVEFLPMAYCRVMLERSGAKFSASFQRSMANGQITPEQPLSSEPVWNAVLAFAKAETDRGISEEDLVTLAARSAEFHAANQLLNGGSKLKAITFTPVVFPWPDDGPKTEN